MKLLVETIVLDGMPFLPLIYSELRKLDLDWTWAVIEGASAATDCTSWIAPQTPRLSRDGTTEYLQALTSFDTRVQHFKKELWQGKRAMLNEPLRYLHEPAVLLQMDSDEIFTSPQIDLIHKTLSTNFKKNSMWFHCRYFLGPKIVITSKNTYGGNDAYEWRRAWRVGPQPRFASHEPPKLENFEEKPWTQEETEGMGLVFEHFSWTTQKQVEDKCALYGSPNNKENGHHYAKGVEGWRKLQEIGKSEDVSKYLPWIGPGVTCDRI